MPRPGPRRQVIALRLDAEGLAAIDARAEQEGVNRSEMIRRMLANADAGYTAGRAAAAADIRAALAADEADDDVSSGEAVWEQGGYRNGLRDAAEIAEGEA